MTYGIHPDGLAELNKANAGQKYQPSNGTEGECFFAAWCSKCQRDKSMREGCDFDECDENECCNIIANTMAFSVDDPEYPVEWQYGEDGQPCCTAFVPAGETIPEQRCAHTMELFLKD